MRICFVASPGSIHTQRWATWFISRGHVLDVVFPHSWGTSSTLQTPGDNQLKAAYFAQEETNAS
jgi:hypothetical protein